MSFRIFNSQKNDTISDYINKQCNKKSINVQKILYNLGDDNLAEDYDDTCYIKYNCLASESIQNYNILQKYITFYNNYKLDSSRNKIINFNGKINQSNYLQYDFELNTNSDISHCINLSNKKIYYIDPCDNIVTDIENELKLCVNKSVTDLTEISYGYIGFLVVN